MVNFSDLGKMAGKIDVSGFVKNVKSIVNPDQIAPAAGSTDTLSQKMAEITAALQALNKAVPILYKEIENLKKSILAAPATAAAVNATEVPVSNAPASGGADNPEAGPKV